MGPYMAMYAQAAARQYASEVPNRAEPLIGGAHKLHSDDRCSTWKLVYMLYNPPPRSLVLIHDFCVPPACFVCLSTYK